MITVSVGVLAYNQIEYIKQCLDSLLMQKTNFNFEILINDDCSTDGTIEIIKEYEQKYPDIIKPIYQKENQFSKGKAMSKNFIFPRISGKYFALCEGDDYWTDENKLQKQVDFMEANPDCSLCFHYVKRIFENNQMRKDDIFPTQTMKTQGFTFKNLLKYNFIQTNSVMYRFNAVKNIFDKFPENILPGDWYLHLLFAKQDKIGFLNETMSAYRVNQNSIWGAVSRDTRYLKYSQKMINFFSAVYNNITDNDDKYYLDNVFRYYIIIATCFWQHKFYTKAVKFAIKNFKILFNLLFTKSLYARCLVLLYIQLV